MNLDLPLENDFMPKRENLKYIKIPREPDSKPGVPKQIRSFITDSADIWFKQDDSFDQPFIYFYVRITTRDCGFPSDISSWVLTDIWTQMLDEAFRETEYQASLAGIHAQLMHSDEAVTIRYSSYNDMNGGRNFIQKLAETLFDFQANKDYFYELKEKKLRAYSNQL